MVVITTKPTEFGTVEVFEDGKRTTTTTPENAKRIVEQNKPAPKVDRPVFKTGETPTATRPPITDPRQTIIEGRDRTAPTAEEQASIREETRKRRQGLIDETNKIFDIQVGREETAGVGRLGSTRARGARAGILGTGMGGAQLEKTKGITEERIANINAQRNLEIQRIFEKTTEIADKRIQAEKDEAFANSQEYLDFLQESKDDAREDIKFIAQAGVSLEELSNEEFTQLLDSTGFDPLIFKAFYNANLPKSEQPDIKYQKVGDNKIVAFSVDPTTGQLSKEEFDFPISEGEEFQVMDDGTPIIVSTDSEGKKSIRVAEDFEAGEFEKEKEEKELDTFIDAEGNRVSIMYDPATKKTRRIVHGKAKGADDEEDEFGAITKSDQAKAKNWLLKQPDFTDEDLKLLETDREFQAWVLEQAKFDI